MLEAVAFQGGIGEQSTNLSTGFVDSSQWFHDVGLALALRARQG
jgi:hypothetical protein